MTSLSENTVVTTSGGLVELAYAQMNNPPITLGTALVSLTNGPISIVSDGSPIILDFNGIFTVAAGNQVNLSLYKNGSLINQYWAYVYNGYAANVGLYFPIQQSYRDTPSAGINTYEIRAFMSNTNASPTNTANTGTFTQISKIIQASQFIVPLASAPLVTSLPSAPIDGQEIRYVADATNGVIWNLRYRAASSSLYKWEFVGGAPLSASTISGITGTISSTSFVSASGGNISVSLPLAGDYWTTTTILGTNNTGGAWWMGGLDGPGSTIVDQFCARLMTSSANYFQNGAASILRTFTSSGTVDMKYRVTSGIATIAERGFSLTPIRVG